MGVGDGVYTSNSPGGVSTTTATASPDAAIATWADVDGAGKCSPGERFSDTPVASVSACQGKCANDATCVAFATATHPASRRRGVETPYSCLLYKCERPTRGNTDGIWTCKAKETRFATPATGPTTPL